METAELKKTIAGQLAYYRKKNQLTQAELAEKINYSDKSVSKWERGDGVPDIFVLSTLAELYGITVDAFLSDAPLEQIDEPESASAPLPGKSKLIITLLSAGLVWLVASVVFFALRIALPDMPNAWMAFIAAIPASLIVVVVFSELWGDLLTRCISASLLIWSVAVFIDVLLSITNIYLIYIVAAVLQILTILWYLLKVKPHDDSDDPGGE